MKLETKQNEPALVCAAQRCDKEALQLLLTRNWSWLKGLVFSIVGNADEVDDVLQDICVRVITEILDIPITTVQIRLMRARRMIHDRVASRDKNEAWEK